MEPQAKWTTFSPEKAQRILDTKNPMNRSISAGHVARMADDMRNGRWDANGETIKFDSEGNLLDGQHRLQAIAMSGTSQKLLVVRGLDAQARNTVDSGRRRTVGDRARMSLGIKNSPWMTAGVRFYLSINEDQTTHAPVVSDSRVLDWCENNLGLTEAILSRVGRLRPPLGNKGFLAALIHLCVSCDTEVALAFFKELRDNTGEANSATRALYTYVSRNKLEAPAAYYLTLRTWNDWIDGNKVSSYRVPRQITALSMPTPKK